MERLRLQHVLCLIVNNKGAEDQQLLQYEMQAAAVQAALELCNVSTSYTKAFTSELSRQLSKLSEAAG